MTDLEKIIVASLNFPDPSSPKFYGEREGRELFWGEGTHYPQMGIAYRNYFQKIGIDQQQTVKVYNPICGSDMCHIASADGSYVDYVHGGSLDGVVKENITYNVMGKKIHVFDPSRSRQYVAHLTSFVPVGFGKENLDFDYIYDTTLPKGFFFHARIENTETEDKDAQGEFTIPGFKFYATKDYTSYWLNIITGRIIAISKNSQVEQTSPPDAVSAFKRETKRWMTVFEILRAGKLRIVTDVYQRNG